MSALTLTKPDPLLLKIIDPVYAQLAVGSWQLAVGSWQLAKY